MVDGIISSYGSGTGAKLKEEAKSTIISSSSDNKVGNQPQSNGRNPSQNTAIDATNFSPIPLKLDEVLELLPDDVYIEALPYIEITSLTLNYVVDELHKDSDIKDRFIQYSPEYSDDALKQIIIVEIKRTLVGELFDDTMNPDLDYSKLVEPDKPITEEEQKRWIRAIYNYQVRNKQVGLEAKGYMLQIAPDQGATAKYLWREVKDSLLRKFIVPDGE